ncbi:hypothetical protein B566_EDAN018736 [Ephemera danica]|nr:hypothetical protein B566_EDAN018736 [Ephemera danica]
MPARPRKCCGKNVTLKKIKVDLAARFVVHHAGPLRAPVVDAGKQAVQRTGHQHVVEVGHHVIGVMQLLIDRGHGKDQAGEAAHGEDEDEAHRKQHRGLEGHRAPPHGGDPVEDLHARGHRDQHRGVHEEQLPGHRHAGGVHVVRPHDERQDGDGPGGVDHGGVAKQPLACERRDDGADDAEGRQDHDVDLGVPEEPEHMLVEHRVTPASGVEEAGAEVAVSQRHGDGAGQHRHHGDEQEGGDEPGPCEQWHLHQRHAGCAHVQDGDDDVDRAHDGAGAHDVHGEDAGVHRRAHLQRQRCIQRPACGRCAARHEEACHQHQRGRNQQPEAEVVHAREGHVRSTDLQRNHPVRKAHEGRHDGAEHHDQPVHGGELVELLRVEELQARLEQFGANAQCQHTANHQHGEAEQQVQRADVLVVGGEDPTPPTVRVAVVVVIGVMPVVKHCAHGDDGGDFRVRQLLPRRHGAVVGTVQQHGDLLGLVGIEHDGGGIQRLDRACALAAGLVAGCAVGGIDLFSAGHQFILFPHLARVIGLGSHFLLLARHPGGVVGLAQHLHMDRHVRVFLAAQLGALAIFGGAFGTSARAFQRGAQFACEGLAHVRAQVAPDMNAPALARQFEQRVAALYRLDPHPFRTEGTALHTPPPMVFNVQFTRHQQQGFAVCGVARVNEESHAQQQCFQAGKGQHGLGAMPPKQGADAQCQCAGHHVDIEQLARRQGAIALQHPLHGPPQHAATQNLNFFAKTPCRHFGRTARPFHGSKDGARAHVCPQADDLRRPPPSNCVSGQAKWPGNICLSRLQPPRIMRRICAKLTCVVSCMRALSSPRVA